MEGQFYLQDSRTYEGNDILFWAKDGKGYTTDTSKAHVYTRDGAFRQHEGRETDVPWPKDYIDARVRPAADMQYCDVDVALKEVGEKRIKPRPIPKETYRCYGCGVFMTEADFYSAPCEKCDCDNRP